MPTKSVPPKKKPADETVGDTASYEAARGELAEIVRRLEAGGVDLDEAVALWERGEKLATICQDWLDGAREKITSLVSDEMND